MPSARRATRLVRSRKDLPTDVPCSADRRCGPDLWRPSAPKAGGPGRWPQGGEPASRRSAASKAWLAKNAKEPGVVSLPDGLQYKVLSSGPASGNKPHPNDEVKVNYDGKLVDGTTFDSSYDRGQPYAAPLKNLVKAWQEALPLMRPGDVWMLYVPPELELRRRGSGPDPRRRPC